jgi:hypothetical protein
MKIEEIAGLIQIRSYLLDINNNRNIVTSENKSILREAVAKIDTVISKEILNDNFLNSSPIEKPKQVATPAESKQEKQTKPAKSTKSVKKVPKTFSKEDDEKLLNESIK